MVADDNVRVAVRVSDSHWPCGCLFTTMRHEPCFGSVYG